MNILLQGYFDRNFGDDMMILTVCQSLKMHKFYVKTNRKELLLPFSELKNLFLYSEDIKVDVELLVIGSGFIINSKLSLLSEFLMGIRDKKIRKRAVIGCNIGPFINYIAKRSIMKKMKKFDLITVREQFSYELIKSNIKNANVYCYPDIMFSLNNLPEKTGEGCLGIVCYRRINEENLPYYIKMANAADSFMERTGKRVLLFAFDAESENDISAAMTIKALCKFSDNVEIIVHSMQENAVINGFSRCDKIVSARFHGIILAIKMGISVLPISYSEKTVNMLKGISYPYKTYDINSIRLDDINQFILSDAKPFIPDKSIAEAAANHIKRFEEMCRWE